MVEYVDFPKVKYVDFLMVEYMNFPMAQYNNTWISQWNMWISYLQQTFLEDNYFSDKIWNDLWCLETLLRGHSNLPAPPQ